MTLDRAERLSNLISRIIAVLKKRNVNNGLYEHIDALCAELEVDDFHQLQGMYAATCAALKRDIESVPLKKESVRAQWLKCVDEVSSFFSLKTLLNATTQVIGSHFTARNMEILESISERLQDKEQHETNQDDLNLAIDAVRSAIEEMLKASKLDPKVSKILKHYLDQMEAVYRAVDTFGEDIFWRQYKEIFGTFIELHEQISMLENKDAVLSKIYRVAGVLGARGVAGVSFAANLGTAATFVLPLLK